MITRDRMDAQQPQAISQALRYTAGVYGEARPGARYDSLFLRGFGGGGGANYVSYLDLTNSRSTTAQDKWPVSVPSSLASVWADYTVQDGTSGSTKSCRPTARRGGR